MHHFDGILAVKDCCKTDEISGNVYRTGSGIIGIFRILMEHRCLNSFTITTTPDYRT
ncbi:unnamed protein product, partial [Allacma fusca]